MENGGKLRLRGPNGAPFVVTVGPAFTADYIKKMLRTGEWSRIEDAVQAPAPESPQGTKADGGRPSAETPAEPSGKAPDPDRPAVNDPKSDWVTYVARKQQMSVEDAANYTKADLIDMVS